MTPEPIRLDNVFSPLGGFPAAVRCGDFLFLSGQVACDSSGALVQKFPDGVAEARFHESGYLYPDAVEVPVAAQACHIFGNLRRVLESGGSRLDQMCRVHIYQRNKRFFPTFERVRMQFEDSGPAPSSGLGMRRLQRGNGAWLDLDAIALIPGSEGKNREILKPSGIHPPSAFYSQAVKAGPFLFLAGHIPVDASRPGHPVVRGYDDVPTEGRFLRTGRSHPDGRDGPIAAQTWFTYNEIAKLLHAEGRTLRDILNLTVYLQHMTDLPTFHRVHRHFFPGEAPAMTVVECDEVGSGGTLVEIEATALTSGSVTRTTLHSAGTCSPLHAVPAAEGGGLVFLSGALGWGSTGPIRSAAELPSEGRHIVEKTAGVGQMMAAQAWAALESLRNVLSYGRLSLNDLAKVTVYLKDINEFETFARMCRACGMSEMPAISLVEVPNPGPLDDVQVCVEAIAWRGL